MSFLGLYRSRPPSSPPPHQKKPLKFLWETVCRQVGKRGGKEIPPPLLWLRAFNGRLNVEVRPDRPQFNFSCRMRDEIRGEGGGGDGPEMKRGREGGRTLHGNDPSLVLFLQLLFFSLEDSRQGCQVQNSSNTKLCQKIQEIKKIGQKNYGQNNFLLYFFFLKKLTSLLEVCQFGWYQHQPSIWQH